jgi:hypothetical protein
MPQAGQTVAAHSPASIQQAFPEIATTTTQIGGPSIPQMSALPCTLSLTVAVINGLTEIRL